MQSLAPMPRLTSRPADGPRCQNRNGGEMMNMTCFVEESFKLGGLLNRHPSLAVHLDGMVRPSGKGTQAAKIMRVPETARQLHSSLVHNMTHSPHDHSSRPTLGWDG